MAQPDADVIAGFSSGVMPPALGERLSRQDAADLIAYLLSVE